MLRPFLRLAPALVLLAAAASTLRAAESAVSSQVFLLNYEGFVKIRATTGVIRVNVWDRDEARVDVIKHCENPELLEFMRVNFETAFNTLSVTTEIATATGPFGETVDAGVVDVGLTIPRNATVEIEATSANIRIEAVRGAVTVKTTTGAVYLLNLAGAVTLESTHAPLQVAFDIVRDEQKIFVKNVHGGILMKLPASLAAWLKARSLRGSIKSDFPGTIEDDPAGGRRLESALNGGGAHVDCENENGAIVLQRRQ